MKEYFTLKTLYTFIPTFVYLNFSSHWLILQPSRLPEYPQAPSLSYNQFQHMLIRLFRSGQEGSSKYRGQSKGIYTKVLIISTTIFIQFFLQVYLRNLHFRFFTIIFPKYYYNEEFIFCGLPTTQVTKECSFQNFNLYINQVLQRPGL